MIHVIINIKYYQLVVNDWSCLLTLTVMLLYNNRHLLKVVQPCVVKPHQTW